MNNQKETIRKFVSYINNESHLGGLWLPNIQRAFVWNEDQIERFYDSILREYPIGALLIWKNQSEIKHRKFIDKWHEGMDLKYYFNQTNKNPKMLVLDGQQRMQSLFIGLKGSYNKKELYFDILSGDLKAPDDKKYEFKFFEVSPGFPWIKFCTLVLPDKKNREFKQEIKNIAGRDFTEKENDRLEENIELIRKIFCIDDTILYQEVDSIDRSTTYVDDDIVEIFIRANSGGTKLDKSDLLFSLLIVKWDEADDNMGELLKELNKDDFQFSRDFILKSCLTLFDKGAAYKVEKFRDGSTRENIENNWEKISDTIKDVKDFICGKTFIRSNKVLSSYLILIPLIYFRYHYPEKWKTAKGINEYIVQTLLCSSFSGSPDTLIDKCIENINTEKDFILNEIFGVIRNANRALEISKETLLDISYSDKRIHLLFNLWYDFNYTPSYEGNEPQLDHIFPQSVLKTIKKIDDESGKKNLTKFKQQQRDQLANMMLLTKQENGPGGKGNITPVKWFEDKKDDYLELHLIPKDQNLRKIENYEEFIKARQELILKKFDYLLIETKNKS